ASKNNARSVASNHLPKVDIVGVQTESETNQYAYDGLNTGGAFNITVPDETQRDTYSLQLSMPIFQGGAVISRTKQAYAESNKSSEDALFIERGVIQDVRSQYSNVVTLVANLRAQKQAVVSASSALEATKVGYEVGTRNIVDLLQAEKNLYSAERNLSNAKYDYLITTLRLHLAAGTLSPENLIEINNLLG
ncbi:TolC family protein, partial [Gammaproteobacteria bacterium]|nr:TolC family protein [Gammaproteobacteria bacterium]